ncbi:hypothetical protein [Vibrio parahaemolyticus]|uniref:hypothetical protein n=1 Tax=Vibrio parahaemolyticus TaxID=670 RepID=UPI001121C887|nr:hypothetical protein [Vibrio parahaemolyticus]MDG2676315.1 hypothetical protein [Vibrio parahaemolyticus]TOA86234.1 hypothetical protein CGK20_11005 [Vibrio parahaemolyticus]HBH7899497.1 hypothetical protein [Vibrio parahaemolyticus]
MNSKQLPITIITLALTTAFNANASNLDKCKDIDFNARIEPFSEQSMRDILFMWKVNPTAATCLYPELVVTDIKRNVSEMDGLEFFSGKHFSLGNYEAVLTVVGEKEGHEISIQEHGMPGETKQYAISSITAK